MAAATTDTAWYSHTSSVHTMRTWTRVLTSFEEVPEAFQSSFPRRETGFPYTVLIPEDKLSFLQKRNERLICLYDDQVVVMEARRDQLKVTPYPFQDILFVEQGRVLLHSWLTIGNQSGASTMSFNTVTIHHFEPIMTKIRQAMTVSQAANGHAPLLQPDLSGFDYLSTRNYKFMNYGRQSIRAGDTIRRTVYQPDRCIKTIKFFNRTLFRQYATGHLSILTEKELILIRESKRTKTDNRNLYGGVFTYIPLRQIQDLAFTTDREKSQCVMQITLTDKIHLRAEFALDNTELDAFQTECKNKFLHSVN
jgi:hypothetical protein